MRSFLWLVLIIVLIAIVIWWLMRRSRPSATASISEAPRLPDSAPQPAAPAAMNMAMPEAAMPLAEMPDMAMPEAEMPDMAMPEAEMPDMAMPEADMPPVEMPEEAAAPSLAFAAAPSPSDDLTRIEGIGPKVLAALNGAGIDSYAALAATDPADLRRILRDADLRLQDPTSWPDQARLAAAGDWDGLDTLQAQLVAGRYVEADDLTLVEGIGPKVAAILGEAGITTFRKLANTEVAQLEHLLREAGLRMMNPASWPDQARLAAAADHEGLQRLQEQLKGGRRV